MIVHAGLVDELKWDDLRTFLSVARTGTLVAAGEALKVNASTVHRRIAALEQTLGADLFERDPRGYSLTSVGEALVPKAVEVEEAISALRRTATGHDRSAAGPVSITMPPSLVSWVAVCLVALRSTCPGLRPTLLADERMLDLGVDTDVALRPSAEPPEAAVGRKLGQIAQAVYRPVQRGRGGRPLPWVVYSPGRGPLAAAAWRRHAHPDVEVSLALSSVVAMEQVLVRTHAQGILPCYVGDSNPALERVGEPIAEAAVDLWLLIHADLRRSARVRALIDGLVPELERLRPLFSGAGS